MKRCDMVKLDVLNLLEQHGKTKYWLYKQLGMSYQNFNKMVNNETQKEVEVDIQKVNMDKFIDSMIKAEIDFTPATINNLQFMFN